MTDRALYSVVAQWLPSLGASPDRADDVAARVAEQMKGLPTPLRIGVTNLQRGLSLLPSGTVPAMAALPGAGEYVRLVRSLTTVVYLAEQEAAS